MTLYAGDVATLTYRLTVEDDNGVEQPTDSTAVTLTVTAPDGTISSYTNPDHPGTGDYRQEVLVPQSGFWTYLWASADPTDVESGQFLVEVLGGGWSDERLVRLLINDTGIPVIFSDTELEQFLALEGGMTKLAAALALDTLAANEVLVQKRIKTLDLSTDGPAEADSLHRLAESLRTQHYNSLADADDSIETTTTLGVGQFGRVGGPELTEDW